MVDMPPEWLDASPNELRSLCSALTGYSPVETYGLTQGVWLLRGTHTPLLVTSVSRDIVSKFEVFTLALQTSEQLDAAARESRASIEEINEKLRAAGSVWSGRETVPDRVDQGNVVDWPFATWRVDVLWKRGWTISQEQLSDDWPQSPTTHFGAAPAGYSHACLVAEGLLFTGDQGSRLLISQGEMPLDLLVTRDEAQIDAGLKGTLAVEVTRYLEAPAPEV